MNKQKIHLFIDDSGRLEKNSNYFVYAGHCFIGDSPKNKAKGRYKKLVHQIAEANNFEFELKASNLENINHRSSLYRILQNEISFDVSMKVSNLKEYILADKKSRQRFKDYAIRRVVKKLFQHLITQNLIDPNQDIELHINIDQQGFATNGLYGLGDGVFEELHEGIYNFNYGKFYSPILNADFSVYTRSCVSENDYLIQAADILANRVSNSYVHNRLPLRTIPNHIHLWLP
ncbi:DUF3800 domain-containing protein [Streptococcus sp. Marseille-P7376]|uniref:DUF3800 domain-containing protein n=1 Tax=Streptococcus sp. Marseille-P7376 TaxID=2592044 RepID=UPI0011E61932|nr:DUF3800 domain-containing protein [Streptococcus sp. Marseille-P7376]